VRGSSFDKVKAKRMSLYIKHAHDIHTYIKKKKNSNILFLGVNISKPFPSHFVPNVSLDPYFRPI